uniref:Uncharacterized protein n=1 Tax=Meloidogyne hapla TaxID=6305 RepID=A0A1I8BDK1_MELHA
MRLLAIFLLIILLAMAMAKNSPTLRRGNATQFSTGHSSTTSFDRAMNKVFDAPSKVSKKVFNVAKKNVVKIKKESGKFVEQVVTKRKVYKKKYNDNLEELENIADPNYYDQMEENYNNTKQMFKKIKKYFKNLRNIRETIIKFNIQETKVPIYAGIEVLFLNGDMEINKDHLDYIAAEINEYSKNEEELFEMCNETLQDCQVLTSDDFSTLREKHEKVLKNIRIKYAKYYKTMEDGSKLVKREAINRHYFKLFPGEAADPNDLPPSTGSRERKTSNNAFNKIVSKLKGIPKEEITEQLERIEGNVEKVIGTKVVKVVLNGVEHDVEKNVTLWGKIEENHTRIIKFYRDIVEIKEKEYFKGKEKEKEYRNTPLKINFHFDWANFHFNQGIHDISYKPTPMEGSELPSEIPSGSASPSEHLNIASTSGQKSGNDTGHIQISEDDEEEDEEEEDDEEEDDEDGDDIEQHGGHQHDEGRGEIFEPLLGQSGNII